MYQNIIKPWLLVFFLKFASIISLQIHMIIQKLYLTHPNVCIECKAKKYIMLAFPVITSASTCLTCLAPCGCKHNCLTTIRELSHAPWWTPSHALQQTLPLPQTSGGIYDDQGRLRRWEFAPLLVWGVSNPEDSPGSSWWQDWAINQGYLRRKYRCMALNELKVYMGPGMRHTFAELVITGCCRWRVQQMKFQ